MRKAMLAPALAVLIGGCGDNDRDDEEITRVDGPPVEVFGAEAQAFGLRDGSRFTELGVELPMAAIDNADASGDFELRFPAAVTTDTGFVHVWLNYEAEGHGPPGVFDIPHFDLHFYFIDEATRAAITCPETEVARERIPPGFVIPGYEAEPEGACVPGMGVHAVPVTTGEEPFTSTMILVYHDGELVALEPMFTKELLLARQDFTLDIQPPEEAPPGVRLPTEFVADYDQDANAYRFWLNGLAD